MGWIPEPTPEMGDWTTEIRRESAIVRGPGLMIEGIRLREASDGRRSGSIELDFEDIAKLRACLDQIDSIRRYRARGADTTPEA